MRPAKLVRLLFCMALIGFPGDPNSSHVMAQVDSAESLVDPSNTIESLISSGEFAAAEQMLLLQIPDPEAPTTTPAAVQLEILRRTRYDFSLSQDEVLQRVRKYVPDASKQDVEQWRVSGDVQSRMIDGQMMFFRRSVSNLFRFNAEARQRRESASPPSPQPATTSSIKKDFRLVDHIEHLVRLSKESDTATIFPVKQRIHYELQVPAEHPRLKPGAVVRVWLPFPQAYRQQGSIRLVNASPTPNLVADNGSPHRTIYFEETMPAKSTSPQFVIDFEYVTSAYCPKLSPELVQPYDHTNDTFRRYTAERPPHIVFTPEISQLSKEIVGTETNPLSKALRIFHWISENVPWCAEMEYSIIPNLSAKGLAARRGDCGVQGLTFITLCRAAGVPARWQSGWQTMPGDWNMHDWSEIYIEPWGWLPVDASYGVQKHADPRVRDFFCGHIDPYRLIVNLDYGRSLLPKKVSFRSEPNDFQRGEVEIDGQNLYFDEWDWKFRVESKPLSSER